jgi:hypothetical protein
MAFWSTNFGDDTLTLKDPKRKFRFMVTFDGIAAETGGGELWYASSVDKPGFAINAAEHKYLNHTFYYPGNVTWSPVSMTLVDPVNPDVTATLLDIIEASGYAPPSLSADTGEATIGKAQAAQALGSVKIEQLDAAGGVLETWTLINAFITDIKFGNMSYGEDGLQEVTLELRYDWSKCIVVEPSAKKDTEKTAGHEFMKQPSS